MDQPPNNKAPDIDVQLNNYRPGDEEEILHVLSTVFPHSWENIENWRWKHSNRPAFREQEVVTASVAGNMVACFHGATLPLTLEPGIVVPMSFDGDFAVLPDYRGQHIPARVHDLTDRRLKEEGVALRGGFTSPALNERFYHKQFGYVFIPTASVNFRKIIGIKSIRNKITVFGEQLVKDPGVSNSLVQSPLIINFEVEGFAPLHLEFSNKSFCLSDSSSGQADVYIKTPYNVIMSLSVGTGALVKSILSGLLRGRLRVRGLYRARKSLLPLLKASIRQR